MSAVVCYAGSHRDLTYDSCTKRIIVQFLIFQNYNTLQRLGDFCIIKSLPLASLKLYRLYHQVTKKPSHKDQTESFKLSLHIKTKTNIISSTVYTKNDKEKSGDSYKG